MIITNVKVRESSQFLTNKQSLLPATYKYINIKGFSMLSIKNIYSNFQRSTLYYTPPLKHVNMVKLKSSHFSYTHYIDIPTSSVILYFAVYLNLSEMTKTNLSFTFLLFLYPDRVRCYDKPVQFERAILRMYECN